MTSGRAIAVLIGMVAGVTACQSEPQAGTAQAGTAQAAELGGREQRIARRLATADADSTRDAPLARWILPPDLREISGLALTDDARLLAHNDEQGRVYVIDPRRGVVLKTFSLGESWTRGDFEGITVAGSYIYMLTSNGKLYQFEEGADRDRVPYKVHDLRLGRECEFEGVAFEADSAWLILPCKTVFMKGLRDELVIYRWRTQQTEAPRLSMFTVPLARVIGSNKWKKLHPSDITIDPATGNYVLITAAEKALIEITPAGELVRSVSLPGKPRQPEAIAIMTDSIMILGDEATSHAGTLTLYRWPIGAAAGGSQ